VHKEDNLSIMNDNIKLIDMINKLRNEVTDLEIQNKTRKTRTHSDDGLNRSYSASGMSGENHS